MIKFFVTAVNDRTQEVIVATEIYAEDFDAALRRAYALGRISAGVDAVRVTGVNEQSATEPGTCTGRLTLALLETTGAAA